MHRNQREYDLWNEELTAILNGNERLTKKEGADLIENSPGDISLNVDDIPRGLIRGIETSKDLR